MKKTKTILALLTALTLLVMAACQPVLESTGADLGDFNDARTNQGYPDSSKIKGTNYFPKITAATSLNGGNSTPPRPNTVVKIDFATPIAIGGTSAVSYAKTNNQTLDILRGEDVADNIKKAIIFEGVTHSTSATYALASNGYTTLTISAVEVEGTTVYVTLPALSLYDEVRPFIKAENYIISGKAIDTDENLKGGEPIFDDYYYDPISIANGNTVPGTDLPTYPNMSETPPPVGTALFGDFGYHSGASGAYSYIRSADYAYFAYDGSASYSAELNKYIKLEKWNVDNKSWDSTSIQGQYATSGTLAGEYFFTITYTADSYAKYRIVAENLHEFKTGKVMGFERRFVNYPNTTDKVTVTSGKKVLNEFNVWDDTYRSKHTTGGAIFTAFAVQANDQGKGAVLILDVDKTPRGPLGNQGLAPLPTDINANLKLAYAVSGTYLTTVYDYINIAGATLRADPTDSTNQQLVLTLDSDYTWVNDRRIYIFAKDGIQFDGDDALITTGRKLAGSLGDLNGTINIDGNYQWGSYGDFIRNAGTGITSWLYYYTDTLRNLNRDYSLGYDYDLQQYGSIMAGTLIYALSKGEYNFSSFTSDGGELYVKHEDEDEVKVTNANTVIYSSNKVIVRFKQVDS
jgi:hypothetical protein